MLRSLPADSKFFYTIYYALLELLGDETADSVFASAGMDPFDKKAAEYFKHGADLLKIISGKLVDQFGVDSSRGLLIRMGGATLGFFRRYFPAISQLGNLENRLKPVERRFENSLDNLAALITNETGVSMVVTRISSQSFEWKMMDQENSGLEFSPISSFCFGLLEEFCQWLDSRKNYVLSHVDLKDDPQPAIITIDIRDME